MIEGGIIYNKFNFASLKAGLIMIIGILASKMDTRIEIICFLIIASMMEYMFNWPSDSSKTEHSYAKATQEDAK